MTKKINYIIGIDEVGRGALAGPVVVAVLAISTKLKIKNIELRIRKKQKDFKALILNSKSIKLKDSKKLSSKQREIWFQYIKQSALSYRIAAISPKIIDRINISNAANLAAKNALRRLTNDLKLKINDYKVFLDGGLYIKDSKLKNSRLCQGFGGQVKTKTIIKGDEKIPAISLASIIAKVSRDRYMKKLHKKYPQYDFIHNVGYGTKKHIKAIKKYGLSPIHRKTFKI